MNSEDKSTEAETRGRKQKAAQVDQAGPWVSGIFSDPRHFLKMLRGDSGNLLELAVRRCTWRG